MNKTQKYEMMYYRFGWTFILVGVIYVLLSSVSQNGDFLFHNNTLYAYGFFVLLSLLNIAKRYLVLKRVYSIDSYYFCFKIVELFLIVFAMVCIPMVQWIYIFLMFPIIITSLYKGKKAGRWLVLSSFIMHTAILILYASIKPAEGIDIYTDVLGVEYIYTVLFYVVMVLMIELSGSIYLDIMKGENDKKRLLGKIEERYKQLKAAQTETKQRYMELENANKKLEETNRRLTCSVAELYTLRQISQAINSIFDIQELLKCVNDIILGVMGTNYSSIILLDNKTNVLKAHTTNIWDRIKIADFNEKINCTVLFDVLNSRKPLLENNAEPSDYPFITGREVKSLICIPFSTKSREFGLILVEHKITDAFDEENIRLLSIIGQQVGIAVENAELYQKMQELATIDGLTCIYNRLYFQQRLQRELEKAELNKYPLSIAIFDIDHFKRFNDNFGHLFGDEVLKSIAKLVKNSLRSCDIVARFGGEEFIILLSETNLSGAYKKVESLREDISHMTVSDKLVTASVTVSFGISSYPECALSETDLIRTADDALYEAKLAGRNCVKVSKQLENFERADHLPEYL